jgi:hypothetical protein
MRTDDRVTHAHLGDQGHQGHGPHGAPGAQRAPGVALEEGNVAQGTIKAISGATFVLTTEAGELTVTTSAATNFHGLPGRVVREAGYTKLTLAALKVGQRVGVMGERQDDATLLARRVHVQSL